MEYPGSTIILNNFRTTKGYGFKGFGKFKQMNMTFVQV